MNRFDAPGAGELVSTTRVSPYLPEVEEEVRRLSGLGRLLTSWGRSFSAKVGIDILRVVDGAVVFAAGWSASLLYLSNHDATWSHHAPAALLGGFLLVNVLQMSGVYHPDRVREPLARLHDLAAALLLVAAGLVALAFVTKTSDEYSRIWAFLWLVLAFLCLVGVRGALSLALARLQPTDNGSWLRRNVAIVGTGQNAKHLVTHLEEARDSSVRIIGLFDNRRGELPETIHGHPVLGDLTDLCNICRRVPIDRIYIALPWTAESAVLDAIAQLECLPVDIRLAPAPLGYKFLNRRVSYLHQLPMINVADRPLGDWARLLKLLEDHVLAIAFLLILAPLMALVAIAIRIDSPGPLLFRQKRYGFNNQLIEVLKFRTMRHELRDENASRLTTRDDPRVTRVGWLLRRTSLDELPQLINVLRGEMSIVGPRPHPIEAKAADRLYQDVVANYAARHKVKPGITGWAQVNGWRGNTETEDDLVQRVEHDIFYLNHWSLLFDCKIIMMTLFKAISGHNAY